MFWYEKEVKTLESKKRKTKKKKKRRTVFYGSSSLRMWDSLETDFEDCTIENQSFGGSTLAACCWFFNRLIPQHKPKTMVLYAGDNDLGDGRHPEEVFLYFKHIMAQINVLNESIQVAFISIKPSPARQHLKASIEFTNKIIKEEIDKNHPNCTYVDVYSPMLTNEQPDWQYYESDGLHLSSGGYKIWKQVLEEEFFDEL